MRFLTLVCSSLLALQASPYAAAHGAAVGNIRIEHPFATPTPPGMMIGAAYLAKVENTGTRADRLLSATSPAAGQVQMHTMTIDAGGVMRMREAPALDLAPGAAIRMRPGAGFHLMLMDLKRPLKVGDSFPMTLQFERAGKVEVKVVVQQPVAGAAATDAHEH
jgi:periplasmic copper chaperone A